MNSEKIVHEYLQLKCDIHLLLLDKGVIEDQDEVLDLDWADGCIKVTGSNFNASIPAKSLDNYIDRGYELNEE